MRRGLELAANGHEAASIEAAMIEEIDGVEHGRMESIAVFDAVGSYAPAMGMLGTLIGLVQMLQSLDDPSALGPAMAVALLTTFYGAFLAHMVAIPIANKLRSRSEDQVGQMELVARGVLAIVSGESPRLMASRLHVALGPQLRLQVAA
jgi:chemotaxis protein MotA